MTYDSFLTWWSERGAKSFDASSRHRRHLLSGGKALPGAEATLDWLRATRFPFRLLTNDGNHSPEEKSSSFAARA
jgi:hypothetical protein